MNRPLFLATAAVFACLIGTAQAADSGAMSWQKGLSRTDLVRQDVGAVDSEVIQARIDFEPGVTSPRHAHPGVEIAHVLSGTFEYQLEGRAPVILKAGESLLIPQGVAHVAKNVGSDKASELATYVVKKGEPVLILKP
ncbi:cupin domain-containing protein [Pseudomonas sp. SWRI111]|uniref:cupin domain-containing protein n=1 Tax=unclassified Pseudomonas TaxID=196821 RepID=UPI0016475EEB|nr:MULTISPECIES: cupin domain-containing protein [unclassified Pseudomonas]MBC3205618.1 cupin domain-containing protein [Pseudomonas sp. SWRI111]MBC3270209.1 cupin domain-containing protein [Pseudomonas sp. SWRI81]